MATRSLVPTFIMKTFEMLEDQTISHIVSWTEEGLSFVVKSQKLLQQQVLPQYFKHRNYSSFLRQLNLYNFKKSKHQDGQEFKHKCFRKGVKQMLQFIKRRNNDDGNQESVNPNQPSAKLKEEQNILRVCASDIKDTNTRLDEDMQILKQKSGVLLEEMWNLKKLLHSQFDQVNHKLERIDIIIGAMSQHKKFKNISQYFTTKFLQNELHTLETNLNQPLFESPKQEVDDQEQIKALFEELQNLSKPIQFD
ncbi:unnamed protein product [Paramecium pentaurelia]|uniref:HSF-type DNA-binding domain-containing protein n=1 Tax=Paramecium pentaurelia TaxID=43138 RepID=A0A8S1S9C7_9CILI|nr:unnamed protein product [Paramecium pentaurelia]